VITSYSSEEIPLVLEATERMHAHLTAAVVSNDPLFVQVPLLTFCTEPKTKEPYERYG